ncbi:MAG: tetratricopeptide repeat protein, partial [Deltaproteobacteria bacterium]
FVTGGPGAYGQPAPGAVTPTAVAPAKKSDPDYRPSTRLQLALGQYHEQRGNRDEARKSYEQVLAVDSRSIEAIIGLARLDQVAGRTADAEAGFQKAIQMDPDSGRALDALGEFYAGQKRWNDAIPLLQRAQVAAPDDKTIRFHHGVALAKMGRIDQAMPLLVEAVGPAAAHYNIGLILHERGDLEGSKENFLAAIMANPRLEQAQYWYNEVCREQDRVQRASATGAEVSGGRRLAPANGGFGGQQTLTARRTAGGDDPAGTNAGFPVEQVSGTAGQGGPGYEAYRQPAGHSAGSAEFAPAPQLTAPVSPLSRQASVP